MKKSWIAFLGALSLISTTAAYAQTDEFVQVYNTLSETVHFKVSADSGKTWNPVFLNAGFYDSYLGVGTNGKIAVDTCKKGTPPCQVTHTSTIQTQDQGSYQIVRAKDGTLQVETWVQQ